MLMENGQSKRSEESPTRSTAPELPLVWDFRDLASFVRQTHADQGDVHPRLVGVEVRVSYGPKGPVGLAELRFVLGRRQIRVARNYEPGSPSRWEITPLSKGRGRPTGSPAAQIRRQYGEMLKALQELRKALRGKSAETQELVASGKWLRRLALHGDPKNPREVPPWLAKMKPWTGEDGQVYYSFMLPLTWLQSGYLTRRIKGPDDAFQLMFECKLLGCSWNQFAGGDFVPSDLARRMAAIRHRDNQDRPLKDSYVYRLLHRRLPG